MEIKMTYIVVLLALQHPIFIIVRLPLFILWSLLTCCCDPGREYSQNEKFEDTILSFDYVEYELGQLNNFMNHPVGR